MSKEAKELQEHIEEFFADVKDAHFILVVDRFVYHHKESTIKKVQELFDSFLEKNHLTRHYANYEFDLSPEAGYFAKCDYSARGVIESLKSCFLSVSHNRFRRATHKLIKENPDGEYT